VKAVLVDDSVLFRQGLAGLLEAADIRVVADLGDLGPLNAVLTAEDPDVVVMDIRMPPTHTDEGIQAALSVRHDFPHTGVLVLSTYAEGAWARELFAHGGDGLGYLLKDRVDNVTTLVEALNRVCVGGTVVDPDVVSRLLDGSARNSALTHLTNREREVLSLMAEGRSNIGIGQALHLSPRTVETYVASIFTKLPLDAEDNALNRRVLAVLSFLHESGPYQT
jgi:DNA-binding NarL/FixJ family response regulator